ncbi:MAG: rhomboid family intramembrane serine protease [Sphingorhabdus sp.]
MKAQLGPVTKVLLALNVALGLLFLSDQLWSNAVFAGGLFPARFTAGDSNFAGFLFPVWLTPFTAAFLHGGVGHLLVNMLMLTLMGGMVERVYGWRLFLLLYVVGIIAAAVAEIIAAPASAIPAIGASGAISAVIAAYVMLFPNKDAKDIGPIPAKIARPLTLMVGWVVLNLMFGFLAPDFGMNIAIWSHIGGFAAGLLLAFPLLRLKYRNA